MQQQIDANRNNQQRSQQQQEKLLEKYMRQSADLQREINRLQSDVASANRNYRRGNNNNSNPTPVVVQAAPQIVPPGRVEPLNDTIYLRDTVRVKDTLTVVRRDTIVQAGTPPPPVVVIAPVARETIVKPAFDYTSIPADVLLFDIGKSAVRPIYYKRLNYIASILKKEPRLQATITGHTDPSGSAAINKVLSEKRAQSVALYLLTKGAMQSQLQVEAVASEEPAVAGTSRSASIQNRRVVVKIRE